MYRQIWKHTHGAICAINFYSQSNAHIATLSGFKTSHYLFTDRVVFTFSKANRVELKFVEEDGYTPRAIISISYEKFKSKSVRGLFNDSTPFAIVNIDIPELASLPGLALEESEPFQIGDPVALLGFHHECNNLNIHPGIVSSFKKCLKNKNYFQFDATVKLGNSGGPIINAGNGKVIGITSYDMMHINKAYEEIKDISDKNIEILNEAKGNLSIQNVDPFQAMIANQHQIKSMAKALYQSSSVRTGFALDISEVFRYFLYSSNIGPEKQHENKKHSNDNLYN